MGYNGGIRNHTVPAPKCAVRASRLLILICLLITVFLCPGMSHARDTIIWMEADMPPFFILNGPLKGQGYEDLVSRIITRNLPEYEHRSVVANVGRFVYNLKHGLTVCTVGFYKIPEREKIAWFSLPSFFTLPAVLIVRRDRLDRFPDPQTVSLDQVLAEGRLRIGIERDRSYGPAVDTVLARYRGRKNLVALSHQRQFSDLFRMMLAGRIDAVLGLPEEGMYHAELAGARDRVATLTISENQQGYKGWLSYVACSKTDWGRKVIERVNQVLLDQRPTAAYRGAYERWLDKNSRAVYRKLYQEVFLKVDQ